jgi:hypothetical protein
LVEAAIMRALVNHPEARLNVAHELGRLGGDVSLPMLNGSTVAVDADYEEVYG